MHNIVNLLKKKAQKHALQQAILYLEDGEHETSQLSYSELDQRAQAIAAKLQKHKLSGQQIALLYPTGVEFLASLMGCWYAGATAVPVPCPKLEEFQQYQSMLNKIADDAQISAILTLDNYQSKVQSSFNKNVVIIATNTIESSEANGYNPVEINNDSIAYLQYTSGSTSAPKAVIITHGNLIHSLQETIKAWHYTANSVTLHWAPHTHVYGLVCGLLVPLYHGTPAIIMPPAAFIKKPLVWLAAISKYKVTHSGCPNFGYDLCIQHIQDEDCTTLNLKSWTVAVNGGDIVQNQTLTSFVNKFSSCGFKLSHFCSAYGMSEISGLIASTPMKHVPKLLKDNPDLPSRVSSGKFISGLQAVVVDPETKQEVSEGQTGEIWISGASVAQGYWHRPSETSEVFNATLPNRDASFFRTGDLGFMLNKELYLTGRLKEVMIVYGKKYYPLDFEITVSNIAKSFQINLPQVVFSHDIEGKEKIIVVQEVPESADGSKLSEAIHHAISKEHGVDVYQVAFCLKDTLPKTASGKLQRKKAQLMYKNNELSLQTVAKPKILGGYPTPFTSLIANVLKIEEQSIDLHAPISRYGFDSINILQLTTEINNTYQVSLSPAILYDFPTLAAFHDFLFETTDTSSQAITHQQLEESRDIAIIGMNGLFPQSPDLNAFWDNLEQGNDCISEVPAFRWDWQSLTIQWGGFIEGVEYFDAPFFNVSPREAELIDPQQRLFLQTVWNTIEDAGYNPDTIASLKTGLYVGVFNHDYAELLQKNDIMDAYLTTGTMNSMIANRISYFLNLRGPSETIDTACSSSLVAIHQAVQGILNNDCDIAIAGGVNILTTPTSFISAHQAGMLSPDGRCKTFDKDANGYVRGEGVGALLLKKRSLAIKDGDHIYGIIKGTAVNHGGHVNSLTAPNPNAQAEAIVSACRRAQIDVNDIQYIEAHGTGTPLGDPIEINGLKKAFQQLASEQNLAALPQNYCGIGTVKTNIGHLESAAGIAGMIKILLAMKHETIPANLHFNELNPYIEIENSPFYIVDKTTPWPKRRDAKPRTAGISSFGFGGANAHIIIEESPITEAAQLYKHASYLVTLSAKTQAALEQRITDLGRWLNQQKESPNLASLSYTLNTGRQHFSERFCVIVHTIDELKMALSGQDIAQEFDSQFNQLRLEYLQGKAIDWNAIYDDYQQKLSLPTYPFAKEAHWITVKQNNPVHYYHPIWIEKPISAQDEKKGSILILGAHEAKNRAIQKQLQPMESQIIRIEDITPADHIIIALGDTEDTNDFYLLHQVISNLIRLKPNHSVKILCVSQKPSAYSRALIGLAKTLHQEQQRITCRLIEVHDLSVLAHELNQQDINVRYDAKHKRYICQYEPLVLNHPQPTSIRTSGAYLITGGMGKLGYLFAEYLAKTYQAKLILTGRSAFCEEYQQAIHHLEQKGGEAIYVQADVASKKSTQTLIKTAKKRFGTIHGVIHAAGLTKDSLILNKTQESMEAVLSSKVQGTCYLDDATRKEPLDFFVLCSSVSSIFGNTGQSDYAYANAFLDEFTPLRNQQKAPGKTISINWPLWEDGGITIAPEYQQMLKETIGIVSLSSQDGLMALEQSLQHDYSNWIVLPGEQSKLHEALNKTLPIANQPTMVNKTQIKDQVEPFLKKIIAETLKIAPHSIDKHKSFEQYGIDSLMIIQLNQRLEQEFSNLPKTLFFEYQNLAALTDYFIEHQSNQFSQDIAVYQPAPIKQHSEEPIAIIGIQGLFPQSETLDSFWQHLINGDDMVTEVPSHRWRWQDYYGNGPDQTQCKWGGFIRDFDQFDAGFFNISAREANLMDPQQRLFLETAWKTIEDAGYNPFELNNSKVGVFAGVGFSEYQSLITSKQHVYHGLVSTGNSHSLIANRVSYFFNFHGPSESIDTACSSSLVAINRAVQAIRYGECDMAIAGGVSIILNPETVVITTQLGALSPDGRCKAFDKSANGFVKSEGVGAVLLKPLSKAQEDGDHIYAVIHATAVNHGGKALSLTAPNVKAQSELLIQAYTHANLDPKTITYVETHGTGTSLGDPVEIDSLKLAFSTLLASQYQQAHIGLGSVKSSIGHLEPAAGIAGVIKLILAMNHEKLPGLVHFKELNPFIQLNDTPFYIVDQTQDWQRIKDDAGQEIPLRAGISSFGFGGTNAHVVLEEGLLHQVSKTQAPQRPWYLITLSAKHEESLQQKIHDLYQWITIHQNTVSLPSLSFTLNVGKAHFLYRCALVVDSVETLVQALQNLSNHEMPEFCVMNKGQSYTMQSPVFDEIYGTTLNALIHSEHDEQYRDKLFILADLYNLNYPIQWQQLYQGEQVRRVASLPAYPFMKQRHWYDMGLPQQEAIPTTQTTDNAGRILTYLQTLFSEKLQIPVQQIQPDETYEVYGVDSVIGMEITKQLEQDFGPISKTILYECNRLSLLAQYLMKNHTTIKLNSTTFSDLPVKIPRNVGIEPKHQDIAIIGINFQFPMANTMDEFWQNLVDGRDCVTTVPTDRWNYQHYPVQISGEDKVFPHGGFITDVDKFDPIFFNIPPRDAALMDPQERLFMQCAWSTLEDAGYTRDKLKTITHNAVGVFAGMTYNAYPIFIAEEWHKGNRLPLNIQSFSLANRVSYFLDINGPSFVVDTACSSSLAAVHLACESLIRGTCSIAIAGGVNLSLHPSKYHFLGSFNFMSEQGRCTSFAADGTGYVPSEGVGAVLLKPLAQAIADNDMIYGVIKGSSMNHGGKTSGYTVPNPNAQAQVILQALDAAQIDARTISYVEAHGTGTSLGDPIEIRGLQDAFETYTQDKQFCAIGSVKSNIGHLEAAAGMPQIAKVLLQMRHQKLVPTIHTNTLNPFIDFKNAPFYVQRELTDWQTNHQPRRAGISSFGAGGVNVHMIIEEYIAPTKQQPAQNAPYIFVLSAQNEERLAEYKQRMHSYLAKTTPSLRDICFTLQTGRESMSSRFAALVNTKEELLQALSGSQTYHTEENSLVQQWLHGEAVDWMSLYNQQLPNIVSLPTYPFTKRHCWIPSEKAQMEAPQVQPIKNDWLYETIWEQTPLIETAVNKRQGKWLIFSDKELGLVLQQSLTPQACIYCFTGESYQQLNDQVYYINPQRKADYEQVIKQVYALHGNDLQGIIYLCSSIQNEADPSLSLLYTFKSLIQHHWQNSLIFTLVSQTAQQVIATETINTDQHHLWSMARIFAAEQGRYQALLVDVDAQEGLHKSADNIVHEIMHFNAQQNHVAYRGNKRYTNRLKSYEANVTSTWNAPSAALVTGGLGALGYETAQYLVKQGTQFLLLTGSTALSEQKNSWLKQLQNYGVTVKYAAVDVADKNKMQMLIQETEQEWQKTIDGVFHLAGITTDNVTISDMDESLWRSVLDVKVKGALVLHELFNHDKLTSFVLFSSISAVPHFGIAGLSAYAAANEFISGLALYRRSQKLPAISINWVAWAEKGMSHRYSHDAVLNSFGMDTLTVSEGMTLLNTILQQNPAEITVCRIHWNKFLQINATIKHHDFFTYVSNDIPVKPTRTIPTLSHDDIEAEVVGTFEKLLALESSEINKETPFQNYGMDSINGIQYTEALNQTFPDMVSPMDLYRFPTLQQLINHLIQQVSIAPPSPPDNSDIDALNHEQLTQLLKAELAELEFQYE